MEPAIEPKPLKQSLTPGREYEHYARWWYFDYPLYFDSEDFEPDPHFHPRAYRYHPYLSLLSTLGLKVNVEKSTLHPTQQVAYIKGLLNALSGQASLPPDRISKIKSMLRLFRRGVWVPSSQVQWLLGLMASTTLEDEVASHMVPFTVLSPFYPKYRPFFIELASCAAHLFPSTYRTTREGVTLLRC